jgi:hypothetical protein
MFWMLYAFFWVIHQHLNFICRCFGTLCLFHLHRRIGVKHVHPPSYWLRLFLSQIFSIQIITLHSNLITLSNLVILYTYLPMKMEQTECFEMSAYKIQTPVNYPDDNYSSCQEISCLLWNSKLFLSCSQSGSAMWVSFNAHTFNFFCPMFSKVCHFTLLNQLSLVHIFHMLFPQYLF